jgi:hypothetical protein
MLHRSGALGNSLGLYQKSLTNETVFWPTQEFFLIAIKKHSLKRLTCNDLDGFRFAPGVAQKVLHGFVLKR